jgi:hypothetical protein
MYIQTHTVDDDVVFVLFPICPFVPSFSSSLSMFRGSHNCLIVGGPFFSSSFYFFGLEWHGCSSSTSLCAGTYSSAHAHVTSPLPPYCCALDGVDNIEAEPYAKKNIDRNAKKKNTLLHLCFIRYRMC